MKRAGPIEAASGLTSYGELETEILDTATDPAVRAILLDVDSPGGEASGVFDLADLVFEARGLKPVWAVADEEAFSGAYAVASAAERVIVPRTGGVGSVGVVAVHVDRSARDAMEGYRYTTVFAGARKNDFNPHEALGGEARAALQAEVGRVYELFVETVARTVTVKPLTTASMAAAQSAARRRIEAIEAQARERKESSLPLDGLPDLDGEEERDGFLQCQVVYELAARQVTAWTGIEDDPPVTRENIVAVMDLYPVGEQFLQKLTLQQMLLNAAKNVSGPSASGISSRAEGPGIAKPAARKARPARKAG